jgi:threonine/homoserine/homoserine lactone efflux protein
MPQHKPADFVPVVRLMAATFASVFASGVASTAIFSHPLRTVLQRLKRLRAVNRPMGSVLVGRGTLTVAVRSVRQHRRALSATHRLDPGATCGRMINLLW